MYWLWTEEDMAVKGDNMQELIDRHHDIAVIDEDDAAGADFSYYENQAEFNGYKSRQPPFIRDIFFMSRECAFLFAKWAQVPKSSRIWKRKNRTKIELIRTTDW